ncbi:MAG TPA: chemotaxis protein CheB [Arenimonas sp.]|nr:chemotaxis protein CheB [Arenimonas sp.]
MARLLVMGFSAGGLAQAQAVLAALPADYPLAVAVVAHLPADTETVLADVLGRNAQLPVALAVDKAAIRAGRVTVAPPGYHLLVENRERFALSVDTPVHAVRPSIDVLFESAAEAFASDMIAVTLSGANSDGGNGMACVHALGGMTIALAPIDAEYRTLPDAVVKAVDVDYLVNLEEMIALLISAGDGA